MACSYALRQGSAFRVPRMFLSAFTAGRAKKALQLSLILTRENLSNYSAGTGAGARPDL